jgi:hypothetical protein
VMLQLTVQSVLVDQCTWSMNVRIRFPCFCVSGSISRADVVLKSGKFQSHARAGGRAIPFPSAEAQAPRVPSETT